MPSKNWMISFQLALCIMTWSGTYKTELMAQESAKKPIVRLDRSLLKAYWRFPVTARLQVMDSWIEVAQCEEDSSECSLIVEIIPLRKLLARGTFNVRWSGDRSVALTFLDKSYGTEPVTIASQTFSHFWFARSELCAFQAQKPECFYQLELEEKSRSFRLNVYFKKEGDQP